MRRRGLLTVLLVLAVSLCSVPSNAWVTLVVDRQDSGGNGGDYSSIAVDANGAVHVSSYNDSLDALQYNTNASGTWESALVDLIGPGGGDASIAVDGANGVHISYHGGQVNLDDRLKYATNASGYWVVTTVDSERGSLGEENAIALDSAGKAHISYADGYGGLGAGIKYATNASGSWATVTVDPRWNAGPTSSLGVDGSGHVHIAYADRECFNPFTPWQVAFPPPEVCLPYNDLYYATNASGSWTTEAVETGGGLRWWLPDGVILFLLNSLGAYPAVALDSSDKVHILHAAGFGFGGVSYIPGAATADPEAPGGFWIEYLKHVAGGAGVWESRGVDFASWIRGSSMTMDRRNRMHIAYCRAPDSEDPVLEYATNPWGFWIKTTVDSEGEAGIPTSIAVDGSDRAHISYRRAVGPQDGELKYATNVSGLWVTDTLASPLGVGSYSCVALDSAGKVHVSYRQGAEDEKGELKYATNASGAWVTATVDAEGDVGRYTAIAVDSADRVHISYVDQATFSTDCLKVATNASGTWVTAVVVTTGNLGSGTSIAVDSADKIHITYMDEDFYSVDRLQYATNASGDWVTGTVDSGQGTGAWNSIVLDRVGKVWISYTGAYGTKLRCATNASGGWKNRLVDEGSVLSWTSIAVDGSRGVHISYHADEEGVRHATNASGAWVTTVVDPRSRRPGPTSIAVDGSNQVHISYRDAANHLGYATDASGSWVTERVCRRRLGSGNFSSIAVSPAGEVFISHQGGDGKLLLTTDK
jgi:hypothetical protein